jgi:hypothetical protein
MEIRRTIRAIAQEILYKLSEDSALNFVLLARLLIAKLNLALPSLKNSIWHYRLFKEYLQNNILRNNMFTVQISS